MYSTVTWWIQLCQDVLELARQRTGEYSISRRINSVPKYSGESFSLVTDPFAVVSPSSYSWVLHLLIFSLLLMSLLLSGLSLMKSTPPSALSFHLNPFTPIPFPIALNEEYLQLPSGQNATTCSVRNLGSPRRLLPLPNAAFCLFQRQSNLCKRSVALYIISELCPEHQANAGS